MNKFQSRTIGKVDGLAFLNNRTNERRRGLFIPISREPGPQPASKKGITKSTVGTLMCMNFKTPGSIVASRTFSRINRFDTKLRIAGDHFVDAGIYGAARPLIPVWLLLRLAYLMREERLPRRRN